MQLIDSSMNCNMRLRFIVYALLCDNVRRVMKRRKYLNVNTESRRAWSRKYNTETISATRRLSAPSHVRFIRYVNRCKIMPPYCRRSSTRMYAHVRVHNFYAYRRWAGTNNLDQMDLVKTHLSPCEQHRTAAVE